MSTRMKQRPAANRGLVAQLVDDAQRQSLSMDGEGGLLAELTRLVLEPALEGRSPTISGTTSMRRAPRRMGTPATARGRKTVLTTAGPVQITVPRDRAGTFEPRIVAKRQRRLGSIEDIVLSLSACGMTPGDIAAHLADTYGSDVSKTTISTITDKGLDGMAEWQSRPLDSGWFLPVVANRLLEPSSHELGG